MDGEKVREGGEGLEREEGALRVEMDGEKEKGEDGWRERQREESCKGENGLREGKVEYGWRERQRG